MKNSQRHTAIKRTHRKYDQKGKKKKTWKICAGNSNNKLQNQKLCTDLSRQKAALIESKTN